MVLRHWGRFEPLHRLRELAGTTQAGTTLWGLVQAAKQLGLEAKGFETDLEGLKQLELPAVLHWEHNHYVVLEKLEAKRVLIADPKVGRYRLPDEQFGTKWTGKVLWLRPGETFQAGRFTGRRGLGGLLAHLAHYRGAGVALFELALGTILLGLLSLGAPILSQILFDQVLDLRQTTLLLPILAAIFLLSAFRTFFSAIRSLLSGQLTVRINYRMRLGYLNHLLRLPLRIHETRLTGDLLTRFSDLSRVRSMLSSLLVRLPATLFTLVFSFGLLLLYNVKLALVSLLTIPFQALYLVWLAPRIRQNSQAARRKEGEVESAILSSLEGLWTLKAFRAEGWVLGTTEQHIAGLMDLAWKQVVLSNTSRLIFGFLGSVGGLLVLWFGATQVLALELTVGQLVAAYALMRNTMGSISEVTDSISDLQEGIVASDRLMEMLELQPEPTQARYTTLPPLRRALQIRGLRFGYLPDRPVLSDVTFALPKGSYTVLLGANGSGKSTLAALVTRLIEPRTGHIYWDDIPLAEVSLETLRKNMVYLRQEVPLFYATLWDNLLLGHSASPGHVETLLSDLGFSNVIRRLPEGLQTVIGGESPYRLSTGERQMLGLTRALLSDAPILILDEPTATLDQAREQIVVERLRKLKGKCTLLIITHRPALCEPADQILQLQDGRVQVQSSVRG